MSKLASTAALALVLVAQTVTVSAVPALISRAVDTRTEQEVDQSRRKTILIIHGVCGFLAFQISMPIAVVIASVGRSWGKIWFKLHSRIQLFLAFPLAAFTVGLGASAMTYTPDDKVMDKHKILGFVLLGLVIFQGLLGFWAHWAQKLKQENAKGDEPVEDKRRVSNWLHIGIGIAILSLGGLQVTWGLGEFDHLVSSVPSWITVIHFIIAGVPVVIVTPFVIVRGALRMYKGQTFAQAFFARPAKPRNYVPPRKMFLGSSDYRTVGQYDEKDGEQEGLIGHGHEPAGGGNGGNHNEAGWVGPTTREEYEASLVKTESRHSTPSTRASNDWVLFDAGSVDKASISSPSARIVPASPNPSMQFPAHSPSLYPPTPSISSPYINPDFPTSTMTPVSLPVFSPPPPPTISPRLTFMPFSGPAAVNHQRALSSATQTVSTPSSTPQPSTGPSIRSRLSETYERRVVVVPSPSPPPIPPRPVSASTSARAICDGDSTQPATATATFTSSSPGISRHASMSGEIFGLPPQEPGSEEKASLETTVEEVEEIQVVDSGATASPADEGERDDELDVEEDEVVGDDDESTRLMDELERELSVSSSTRGRRIPDRFEEVEADPSSLSGIEAAEPEEGGAILARDQSGKWLGGTKK